LRAVMAAGRWPFPRPTMGLARLSPGLLPFVDHCHGRLPLRWKRGESPPPDLDRVRRLCRHRPCRVPKDRRGTRGWETVGPKASGFRLRASHQRGTRRCRAPGGAADDPVSLPRAEARSRARFAVRRGVVPTRPAFAAAEPKLCFRDRRPSIFPWRLESVREPRSSYGADGRGETWQGIVGASHPNRSAARRALRRRSSPTRPGRVGGFPGEAAKSLAGLLSWVRQRFAPPSTSMVHVHSGHATGPAQTGCPPAWACPGFLLRRGAAPVTRTSVFPLLGVLPALQLPCASSARACHARVPFRPCRFSRLRRLAPCSWCRSVAPCCRP
jgi:hypothetical protein